MKRISKALAVAALVATSLPVTGTAAQAAQQLTGRMCRNEYWYDGNGIQHLGYRCAQGAVVYSDAGGSRWYIDYYAMDYTVSAGLSYGPSNNENPFRIDRGFSQGTSTWLSPDSGPTNGWFNRTDFPYAYTYKGQTHVRIDAYPDVPGGADPDLVIQTSSGGW